METITIQRKTQKAVTGKKPLIAKIIPPLFWALFLGNILYTVLLYPNFPTGNIGHFIRFNGFSQLLWATVTFFAAIVSSYASSYFKHRAQLSSFMWLCLAFTFSVMLLVVSEHVGLLILSWLLMGLFMSRLIGLDSTWGEARQAKGFSRSYFLVGSLLLGIGVCLPAFYVGSYSLSTILAKLDGIPNVILLVSTVCIVLAALIQSAIFPFHKWLLSAMTAPTPASALMHAGFVNGSGILLTLFASILLATDSLDILFIIGGLTAIVAQFTKLIQVNVKQRLACSTIAQMGFMIMQCGLGFFNAAITHLILHGFYKASLFLSSGEEIQQSNPKAPPIIQIKWFQAIIVILFSLIGAYLFARLTGKGMHWDSGIFLTLVASIAVGQATYNIVKQQLLSGWQKLVLPPVLFLSGIGIYALFYNWVTLLMADMAVVSVHMPVSTLQIGFGIIFLIGFFLMKLGVYRKIPWIYVKLMNLSQPHKNTVLTYKTENQ